MASKQVHFFILFLASPHLGVLCRSQLKCIYLFLMLTVCISLEFYLISLALGMLMFTTVKEPTFNLVDFLILLI